MAQKNSNREKYKNFGTIKKLLLFMRSRWWLLIVSLLAAGASSICSVIAPQYMQKIVNEISDGLTSGINLTAVAESSYIAAAFILAGFLCSLIVSWVSPVITQRTAGKMRSMINAKVNKIPLSYFDVRPTGEVLSTMSNDVDTVSSALGSNLSSILTNATTFAGCLVVMFATNAIMAAAAVSMSIIGLILSTVIMKKGRPHFKKNQNMLAAVNSQIDESFNGHLIVKAFGAEDEVMEAFDKSNEQLCSTAWKSQFLSSVLSPLSSLVGNLNYVIVCVLGAWLVTQGQTDIGVIVAFMSYVKLFSTSISSLSNVAGTFQPAFAAAERIFELLDQEEADNSGERSVDLGSVKGEVKFEHVKFGYVPGTIIVKDFSATVNPGMKVAIVGPTGAGKSTLVNLLMRFYELNSGKIYIDGVPVNEMPLETLHSMLGMVLQDTWTFEGTVRDNIVYAKENVTDEQLKNVCDAAGLTPFIEQMPHGIDTVLSESGSVSAGQKQLITIARAMIDDSPLLILDEATSSVDTRTEKVISQAIDRLTSNRTSFVIAHRLSTIRNADVIFVLRDGDIVETGTHDELIAKGGFYADLYMSQFESAAS